MRRQKCYPHFFYNLELHLKLPELTVGEIIKSFNGEVDGDIGAEHLLLLLLLRHLGKQLVAKRHVGDIQFLDIGKGYRYSMDRNNG